MFEELFTLPSTIERYRTAPLAGDRERYLRYLQDFGTRYLTVRRVAQDQLSLVCLLNLKEGDRVSLTQIDSAAEQWSTAGLHRYYRRPPDKQTAQFRSHAIQWLRFTGQLHEPKEPLHGYTAEIEALGEWMRRERGLSEIWIKQCSRAADAFLLWLTACDVPLASLSAIDVDRYFAAISGQRKYSRRTIVSYTERLRMFVRFAERRGWCKAGIASAIKPGRVYQGEKIPARLPRPDVLRLLASTEGDSALDKRDRAILMILIAYGLRSGELRALRLDDVDWENETLKVWRNKSGQTQTFPLSPSVGRAILRYILEVRPRSKDRTLFLKLRAPIGPLSRGAVGTIVRSRLDRLGIVADSRGPHALRHAAAQHLLDEGMSMKVIGDYLGHRDPTSTRTYAKFDLHSLREVADFDLEVAA